MGDRVTDRTQPYTTPVDADRWRDTTRYPPDWQPGARVYTPNGHVAHTVTRVGPAGPVTACRLVVDGEWHGGDRFAAGLPDCQRCTKRGKHA